MRVVQSGAQVLISRRKDQAGDRKFKSTGFGVKKLQEQVSPKCSRAAENSFVGRMFVTSALRVLLDKGLAFKMFVTSI